MNGLTVGSLVRSSYVIHCESDQGLYVEQYFRANPKNTPRAKRKVMVLLYLGMEALEGEEGQVDLEQALNQLGWVRREEYEESKQEACGENRSQDG